MRHKPTCPSCGGPFKKKTRSKSNLNGCIIAPIGIVAGVVIFIFIPLLGWVLGPIIIILSCFATLPKSEKLWKCKRCKYTTIR